MILPPLPLGSRKLDPEALETDKKQCRKIGPCGVGQQALYVGSRFLDRRYYVPWKEVKRVFKRVAMSQGGFSGKGIFGSMAYLVVQYGSGKEQSCRFKREDEADALLAQLEREHPDIRTHSAKAEKRMAEAAAAEEARYRRELQPEASDTLDRLQAAKARLEDNAGVTERLVCAARQKRVTDNFKPGYAAAAVAAAVLGLAAAAYGAYSWSQHTTYGKYILLVGAAVFLLTLASRALPGRNSNKARAQREWDDALAASRRYLDSLGDFPVPAQYAHPAVLDRMIRVVREGRAQSTADALAVMKKDLKALNSSVTVSQSEYDEVVAIKPLFLVCDYRDEL